MRTSKQTGNASLGNGEFLMTEKDFSTIAKLLYEDAGIFLAETKATFVYSRLSKRLRALGLQSFKDYCTLVQGREGSSERMTMLASLTTNVTHFFREKHHFDYLRQTLLPPLLNDAKRGGRVRIWSAGCSIGHEPYSIAMTILSMMGNAADYDVRILASDIDPNVVATGRAGVYGASALESVSTDLRRKWFRPSAADSGAAGQGATEMMFEVTDPMRDIVAFRELNLNGEWPMRGQFDAIFCRNVTIYFDQPTRERVWKRFVDRLLPGGTLFIGHSERVTGPALQSVEFQGNTSYKKVR
ncbi:protein-glutamate O-methyltransferase CheR [Jiella sp. MQZ9-1]|uniref:Chemotaxis protein methyltransferase n=1 Tax=Jiella flava TaxID=2816857 RepID=A0A939JX86_9HYPH|nr:protein-glutamate O-methyltransferase CheR [Jiella flava]MBO0664339.1 protein-glutamate O-methyltransferase CheR [Jiella flava]MCD2472975.1 protein-glutamate O-methyltransferase CheR [Jiella flava]